MMKIRVILTLLLLQLMICGNASSQPGQDIIDNIRSKFENYCKIVPWEEIYVHTDRMAYISGEEIWFNIFLLDRQTSHISSGSSIAYVELLDADNKPVVQKRFRLESGTGPGQITLPDTLYSGTYTMRVYTSWMKNFLPANCWMQDIDIYNPFDVKIFKKKRYDPFSQITAEKAGNNTANSASHLSINTVRTASGAIEITINSDDVYRSENGDLLYLFIQTHGNINLFRSEKTTGNTTTINIPGSSLPIGINHITIFDSKGKPLAENLIYSPPSNSNQNAVIISSDTVATRTKITLQIDSALPVAGGKISISAATIASSAYVSGINNYMVFGSEYGPLPRMTFKGTTFENMPIGKIDSLLNKLKSSWIDWDKVLADKKPEYKYDFEKEEHYLTGLLLAEGQQLGYPGETIVMSTPGKIPQFQYAVTTFEANFTMKVPIDYETNDLVIQPIDTSRNYRIFIESPFSEKYFPAHAIPDSVPASPISYVSRWSLGYQVGLIYGTSMEGEPISEPAVSRPLKRFYGKPDFELIMNNYIKLPTMAEVFFELIPRVSLRKSKTGYEIVFLDFSGNPIYEMPPVIMIDGVIFNDATVVARLDPEVIEKIDIIRGIYHVGGFAFYGIVNVITNAGNFRLALPEYATRISYRVTDPALAFISPDYSETEVKSSRNPDFRNTLYWNPSVKPGRDGKINVEFWSSDLDSEYLIIINGITSEGKPFTVNKTISVIPATK